MKQDLKINLIIFAIIVLLVLIAFLLDYNRVKNKEIPIFYINVKNYEDGGTKEYLGLGYKVIVFHTLNGYDEMKIGTWFMKYDDFEEEIQLYEKTKLEKLEAQFKEILENMQP